MRLLYFHQYFCTPEGSSATRSYEMAKFLVNNGHTVTVVFGESPRLRSPLEGNPYEAGMRRGNYKGIDLIEFNIHYNNKMNFLHRTRVFLLYSIKSTLLVFKEDFDMIFATSTPITAGIPIIIMKLMGKKKPSVFEVRDLWPELPREMGVVKNRFVLYVMEILESLCYNLADACIALSPGIETGIRKKLRKEKPVYMIPNGCDLDLFKPGHKRKSIFPNCNKSNFIAVFVGAHGIANGLDSILDAAASLKETNDSSHIKIVLIGDGKTKPHLIRRVNEENLKNIIFLDPIPKVKLINYLQASDVGLMLLANVPAFYYGTSPNKFFDYISSGLPVINNYPGWLAEMIDENYLGVVIRPDDAKIFAETLVDLSCDRTKLKRMSENARRFAEENFDRNKLAHVFEEALDRTLHEFTRKIH